MGGPNGAGFLYVRNEIAILPLFFGGSQERGLRQGSENLPAIAGFAKALTCAKLPADSSVRDPVTSALVGRYPSAQVNGGTVARLPHILNITRLRVWRPSGCCRSYPPPGSTFPRAPRTPEASGTSHVLVCVGLSLTQAGETLRFSGGFGSKLSDADEALNAIDFAIQNHFELNVHTT